MVKDYNNLLAGLSISVLSSLCHSLNKSYTVTKLTFEGGCEAVTSLLFRLILTTLLNTAACLSFPLTPHFQAPCSKCSSCQAHSTFPRTIYVPYLLCLLLRVFLPDQNVSSIGAGVFVSLTEAKSAPRTVFGTDRYSIVEWIN